MGQSLFFQRTIAREVQCEGVGLHSGTVVSIRLKPALPNFGVRFRRTDISGHPTIFAHHEKVVDTFLATSIGSGKAAVSTVEHLMAALWAGGVDNVLIEVNGPEIPIFDGSAAPYVELIDHAGLREQSAPRRCLRVKKAFTVMDGDAYISVKPSDFFRVRYTIDFPHPMVGRQELAWTFSQAGFSRDIAGARTFGFLKDVNRVQSLGLARGGSLDNTIVFDENSILNRGGFRYNDECVRHKVLDLIGDLALAGMPVFGHFEAYKAGHALHNLLLKELTGKRNSYTVPAQVGISTPFVPSSVLPAFARRYPALAKSV